MLIFAPNTVVAKSRFWYFLMKLRKVKKANGEIISLNVVCYDKYSGSWTCIIGQLYERRANIWKLRSMRNVQQEWRILVSGLGTTRGRARIICTRNTGRCRGRTLWKLSTKIWQLGTEHDSGLSMYVDATESATISKFLTTLSTRFSRLWKSKRPATWSVHTWNNSSRRIWNSLYHIVLQRPRARSSSPLIGPPPLPSTAINGWVVNGVYACFDQVSRWSPGGLGRRQPFQVQLGALGSLIAI